MCTRVLVGLAASALCASSDRSAELAFPDLVQKMLKWPGQKTLNGPQRVYAPKKGRFDPTPLENSLDWIQRILDPNWLPPSTVKDEMIFVKQEYGPLSASHVRWEKNGYKIQVTQTRGIIAIKLEPASSPAVPTTQEALAAYAKGLCMRLFTDAITHRTYHGDEFESTRLEGLRAKIAEYSFECALKRTVAGGLAAAAWHPMIPARDVKPPSQPESQMWYYYIGWYTNGKTVAFWTYKIQGDPWHCWPGCVSDPIGEDWF